MHTVILLTRRDGYAMHQTKDYQEAIDFAVKLTTVSPTAHVHVYNSDGLRVWHLPHKEPA